MQSKRLITNALAVDFTRSSEDCPYRLGEEGQCSTFRFIWWLMLSLERGDANARRLL